MENYDYTYVIRNNSEAKEICEAAINRGIDGGLVLVIVEGEALSIDDIDFGGNVSLYIEYASDGITFNRCSFSGNGINVENSGSRVLFHRCVFNGEAVDDASDSFVKNNGYAVFDECTFRCTATVTYLISGMAGASQPSAVDTWQNLKYTIIMNSGIEIAEEKNRVFIIDGDLNVSVIHTYMSGGGRDSVAWTREMVNENTFSYFDTGRICGSEGCAYMLTEKAAEAFSLRNLLGDMADKTVIDITEVGEDGVFFFSLDRSVSFIAGSESASIQLIYFPQNAVFKYRCVKDDFIEVKEIWREDNKIYLEVSGQNDSDDTIYGFITFFAENGVRAECVAEVRPSIIEPPRFLSTPSIEIRDGRAVIDYELELGGRQDTSEISWYRVDNIDRTSLMAAMGYTRSNERDCRKIAVSRRVPCREITLSRYDIGTHIKVNIKPKHNRSKPGAGLNIMSRIIMASDIKSRGVVINMENQVMEPYYNHETGYGTARGMWLYQRLPLNRHYGMAAASGESSFFFDAYMSDRAKCAMTVCVILDFENCGGEGFSSRGEYQEIYIKYDSATRSGYGLRYECVSKEKHIAGFTLYKYDKTDARPISDMVTGCYLRSGLEIRLNIEKNIFSAFITVPGIDENIEISSGVEGNEYFGMGVKNNAVMLENNKISIRHIEINFSE